MLFAVSVVVFLLLELEVAASQALSALLGWLAGLPSRHGPAGERRPYTIDGRH